MSEVILPEDLSTWHERGEHLVVEEQAFTYRHRQGPGKSQYEVLHNHKVIVPLQTETLKWTKTSVKLLPMDKVLTKILCFKFWLFKTVA